ncbi:MAG: stage III sporulation protein AC [Clostridia bacterium]|nr:stage III sporulation protein AC [Clostridia bacterium]
MQIDIIFKVAGVGVIVAVLNLLLTRSGREEQGMLTTLAGLIVVLMMIIKEIGNMFTLIKSTFGF